MLLFLTRMLGRALDRRDHLSSKCSALLQLVWFLLRIPCSEPKPPDCVSCQTLPRFLGTSFQRRSKARSFSNSQESSSLRNTVHPNITCGPMSVFLFRKDSSSKLNVFIIFGSTLPGYWAIPENLRSIWKGFFLEVARPSSSGALAPSGILRHSHNI